MQTVQVAELLNSATAEALGLSDLLNEDLSNVVDAGNAIYDNGPNAMERVMGTLINQVGKFTFVNRTYAGSTIPIMRDGWEFGSILEKVQADLFDAEENESWELTPGQEYSPHVFYQTKASVKFFNKKVTFEIPVSITEMQIKQSFQSAQQLNAFVSMIENAVRKSITIKMDELIMRTINDLISKVIYNEYSDGSYAGKSGIRAINLLYLYNSAHGTALQPAEAIKDPEFLRFASYQISIVSDRMTKINSVYNLGEKARFTPKDLQTIVLLSEFEKGASTYLYSDVFHNELVRLPDSYTVPFWQGNGQDYNFTDISTINVKNSNNETVNVSGIIGCIFDRDAAMVANMFSRVTSSYNAKAEFFNYFYKEDVSLFNDTDEQCVVFFIS